MIIELIKERIEEIKADIKEFTILELEATNEKDQLRYGLRVAEFKDTLETMQENLKYAEECEEAEKLIKALFKEMGF